MFTPSNNVTIVCANIAKDIAPAISTTTRLTDAALLHITRLVRIWALLIIGLTISACNGSGDSTTEELKSDLPRQTPSDFTDRSAGLTSGY